MNQPGDFKNPYSPGAGHAPPHLAGRHAERAEFERLLEQDTILENLVLTGLRGLGKTVLLELFKPIAMSRGWLWAGSDLSESASVSEEHLAIRLMTDLSIAATGVSVQVPSQRIGFSAARQTVDTIALSYESLEHVYDETPGLTADRLRAVLEHAWLFLQAHTRTHVIFAYDEAQNLVDHATQDQFPLSTLLDVFQSIQRRGIPFMLILTGLPTLFPKLVDARTFSERMFRVVSLDRLDVAESREAIVTPIEVAHCPVKFGPKSVDMIVERTAGYPYFIQFVCREIYDIFLQQFTNDDDSTTIPFESIQRKLDSDFFDGRWSRVTDRQRELLYVIARLPDSDVEFTIHDVVESARSLLKKGFSPSHINQMLVSLGNQGLIYKNRFGKYSFAVPLLGDFILRTYEPT